MALSEMPKIGQGADSVVFRAGEKVIKEYNERVSFQKALEYQMITRAAARDLERNPYEGQLKLDSQIFPLNLSIAPITRVSQAEGKVKAIADFVPGLTVSDIVGASKKEEALERVSLVPDKEEADFLQQLLFKDEPMDIKEEWFSIIKFFKGMSKRLGVEGITLSTENIKVRFDPSSKRFNFVVTDLCAGLLRLGIAGR